MPDLKQLLSLFVLSCVALNTAACTNDTHFSGDELSVRWAVVDNLRDGANSFRSTLTLENTGSVPLGSEGWTLYFNFVRPVLPESLPPTVRIAHVNGDLFKLEPTDAFPGLAPGERIELTFDARYWVIKESEAPTGFYLVSEDVDGNLLPPEPVEQVAIAPFRTPAQTSRQVADRVPVPTPASRYADQSTLTALPQDQLSPVTPAPVHLERDTGAVTLNPQFEVRYEDGLETEARLLAAVFAPLLGTVLAVQEGSDRAGDAIVLRTGGVEVGGVAKGPGDEAYRLSVSPGNGVEIVGTDAAGVFYGSQTLKAVLPLDAYREPHSMLDVGAIEVEDAPRFPFRGMHLDVARNFQTPEAVKALLEVMAFYKLNKFHFHLTDDEGWRVEIRDLPELTDVGGRRGHTADERDHLVPSYGSGPDPDPAASHGSGFYTRRDFVDLLRYARERHIEVIPEIDLPGHARAAIKAMEARYHRLMAEGHAADAGAYRLIDPDDTSEYQSVQLWNDNVINVCLSSSYRFIEHVVDELVAMYDEADAPLTILHTGGDEVPHGAWTASPVCTALFEAAGNDVEDVGDLHDYFLRRISTMLDARGLITGGWEEIALTETEQEGTTVQTPNPAFAGRRFRPNVWNNVWGWGGEANAYKLANAGYDVVLSHATHLYFDLAYDKDPREPGYYWASFVDTRAPFEFNPLDLYKNARVTALGDTINPAVFADHTRLTEAGRAHILGIQGQLWSENIRGPERMMYMALPRLIGLAERAWAPPPAWETLSDPATRDSVQDAAWNDFANRLGRLELPRMDHLFPEAAYRLPPPGAVIEDGMLRVNTALPGLAVHYTTDGTEPTAESPRYSEPVAVSETVQLKTFDTRGRGSRTVVVSG